MTRFCPIRRLWYVWCRINQQEVFWSQKPGLDGQEACDRWIVRHMVDYDHTVS
jgi:hypothetical protein